VSQAPTAIHAHLPSSPVTRRWAAHPNASHLTLLTDVARIMARDREYIREEERLVYQPSLQSGLGGYQANETDTLSVATNATTSVEDSDNTGCGGRGRGRGRGCGRGRGWVAGRGRGCV
jgi:hypothetical protein